jgi:hypothetical protein
MAAIAATVTNQAQKTSGSAAPSAGQMDGQRNLKFFAFRYCAEVAFS